MYMTQFDNGSHNSFLINLLSSVHAHLLQSGSLKTYSYLRIDCLPIKSDLKYVNMAIKSGRKNMNIPDWMDERIEL